MEKKKGNVLLTIMGVLIVGMIIITICNIKYSWISGICRLISLVFAAAYCFVLYKKPHGNMLKYAMLLFAASEILNFKVNMTSNYVSSMPAMRLFAIAGIIYCTGRLERIDQNKILFTIIEALYLIFAIYDSIKCSTVFGPMITIRLFGSFIILATLIMAYFFRYKEHKEAGLMDAPKN